MSLTTAFAGSARHNNHTIKLSPKPLRRKVRNVPGPAKRERAAVMISSTGFSLAACIGATSFLIAIEGFWQCSDGFHATRLRAASPSFRTRR